MEKTIKLTLKEAQELYKTADLTFKKFLESNFSKKELSVDIKDRINNWQDVLRELKIDESFLPYKGSCLTKEEKAINAQAKLFKIAEVYNEGTILNWKNTSQYKYIPYKSFSLSGAGVSLFFWRSVCCCSGELFYKSENLAKDAYNKFKDIYEDYWNID